MKQLLQRIGTDMAGYGLIVLGVAFGWLPGPGGIPLILAGLGLLSIHNAWAKRLRQYALKRGGRLVHTAFPAHPAVEFSYDGLVILLLVTALVLAWRHATLWQISLAIALFFAGFCIAGLNRRRAIRLKQKISRRTRV